MRTHIIEAYTTIDESARIAGVALIPRISRNNNLYTKAELKRFDGKHVPLNWEHDPGKVIGTATFHFNPESETVYYDGEITDEGSASLAKNRTLYTSIEADPTDMKEICNSPGDCFHMPFGLVPRALALTETPGVPETSVTVIEHFVKECSDEFHEYTKGTDYTGGRTHTQEVGNPGADDQCIQAKISKIMDEDPNTPHDQAVAMAISMCASKETIKMVLQHQDAIAEYFCTHCGELKKSSKPLTL